VSRYDKDEIKENLAYHHLMLVVEEIARVARVKLGLNERGMSVQSRRRPFPNSSVVSWDDVPVRADVGELSAGEGEREEKRSGRESDGESCDKREENHLHSSSSWLQRKDGKSTHGRGCQFFAPTLLPSQSTRSPFSTTSNQARSSDSEGSRPPLDLAKARSSS